MFFYLCGIPGYYRILLAEWLCHHTAGTDNGIVRNGNALANNDRASNPHMFADMDVFLRIHNYPVFIHDMVPVGSRNPHRIGYQTVAFNVDGCVILYGQKYSGSRVCIDEYPVFQFNFATALIEAESNSTELTVGSDNQRPFLLGSHGTVLQMRMRADGAINPMNPASNSEDCIVNQTDQGPQITSGMNESHLSVGFSPAPDGLAQDFQVVDLPVGSENGQQAREQGNRPALVQQRVASVEQIVINRLPMCMLRVLVKEFHP